VVRGGAGEFRVESAKGAYMRSRLAVVRAARVFTVTGAWRRECFHSGERREIYGAIAAMLARRGGAAIMRWRKGDLKGALADGISN
jgi:hypothetical protein